MTRPLVLTQRWRCDACGQYGEFEHRPEADARELREQAEEQHQIVSEGCAGRLRFPGGRD